MDPDARIDHINTEDHIFEKQNENFILCSLTLALTDGTKERNDYNTQHEIAKKVINKQSKSNE